MGHFGRTILRVIGLAFLLGGCVSTAAFEAKEEEAARASRELQVARAAERRLDEELQALREQRAILESELTNSESQLGSATERTSDLESEIARLKLATAEKEEQMVDLRQVVGEKEREIELLRGAVGDKEVEIERLRSTYNDLVRDLKKEIEAGEIQVTQYRDLLTVNLVEKILFDSGKAEIKPRGLEVLKRVGDILREATDKQIRIEGHTDNVPIGPVLATKYPTNWELSTARATVVARYFQEKVGIPPERLTPAGFAEYRPVAANDTPEGRAQNRRIEIVLAPPRTSMGMR